MEPRVILPTNMLNSGMQSALSSGSLFCMLTMMPTPFPYLRRPHTTTGLAGGEPSANRKLGRLILAGSGKAEVS